MALVSFSFFRISACNYMYNTCWCVHSLWLHILTNRWTKTVVQPITQAGPRGGIFVHYFVWGMFQPSPFNAAGGRRRSRRAVLWLENKQFCYKNYNHLSSREGLAMNDESSAEVTQEDVPLRFVSSPSWGKLRSQLCRPLRSWLHKSTFDLDSKAITGLADKCGLSVRG
jgi:hypothetical protein